MKKLLLLFLMTLVSISINAQNINGRISSSLYVFERYDTTGDPSNFYRAYEMLNLNINEGKFSFRTYMNLESDLSTKLDEDPIFRFYNFYFEGRDIANLFSFKLGRQPIFNSIGGGLFDGLNVSVKKSNYKLSAYYGGNVPAFQKFKFTDDLENDYIFGGKLTGYFMNSLQVDLNYVNKNFKRPDYRTVRFDDQLNPLNTLIEQKSAEYQYASAQVSYTKNMLDASVRYDYDLNFSTTSKVEFNGRYSPIEKLGVNVYYNYREPRINYNSIFAVFDYGNSQEIEAGVDYAINKFYTVVGKFGVVTYGSENSQRITAGLNTNFGNLTYRKTLGNAGELDAISLYAAHSFLEGKLTPSAGVSYTSYKLSENDAENNVTSVLAGLNIRYFRDLSFDLQGQYMNNKIYKDDYRLFFKVNYWFNTNLDLL